MTIALSLKINEGLVLAADSACTVTLADGTVTNVYNNSKKVFHLHNDLPIGAVTWGRSNIGMSSISTLIKDFHNLISSDPEYKIDPASYTVLEVVHLLRKFIYEEHYVKAFEDPLYRPELGLVVGGYSANAPFAEKWVITMGVDEEGEPRLLGNEGWYGVNWFGQHEAVSRLIKGYSPNLPDILKMAGLSQSDIENVLSLCKQNLAAHLINPVMPLKDLIDVARYLVDMCSNFERYKPGHNSVGGPIEIVAITKHEGFQWIQRNHF